MVGTQSERSKGAHQRGMTPGKSFGTVFACISVAGFSQPRRSKMAMFNPWVWLISLALWGLLIYLGNALWMLIAIASL